MVVAPGTLFFVVVVIVPPPHNQYRIINNLPLSAPKGPATILTPVANWKPKDVSGERRCGNRDSRPRSWHRCHGLPGADLHLNGCRWTSSTVRFTAPLLVPPTARIDDANSFTGRDARFTGNQTGVDATAKQESLRNIWTRRAAVMTLGTLVQSIGFATLRSGRRQPVVTPFDVSARFQCTTSVVRVPQDHAQQIHDLLESLPDLKGHYRYPPTDMHVTVMNLDGARIDAASAFKRCTAAAQTAGPFDIELRGIALTSHSLYVQAWDVDGSLQQLRREIATRIHSPLAPARRFLSFVNIARFTRTDLGALPAATIPLRGKPLGVFTATRIEVVQTDKVLSRDGTVSLVDVPLTSRQHQG